jgi:ankyrin repeat protein
VEGGTYIERTTAYRSTALHQAAFNGYLDMCRLLLDWGAKVNHLDEWKETRLHRSTWTGHLSVMKLMVEKGA